MTNTLKKVALVGGSGNIGAPVLSALLDSKAFDVTVLSRAESKSAFPASVHVAKVNYDSVSSLTDALRGQDAVVSTLGAPALDAVQHNLVEAAAAAGVKLFVPSEFGVDTTSPAARDAVVFAAKPKLVADLEARKVPYAVVQTGPFIDWGLANGFLGVDAAKKEAYLIGDGSARVSGTSTASVGRAVVAVLKHAEKARNRRLFVSDAEFSQNELLAAVQERVGKDGWTVKKTALDAVKAEGLEKIADPSHFGVIQLIRYAIFSGTEASYWGARDNSAEFGIKQVPLKDIVAATV